MLAGLRTHQRVAFGKTEVETLANLSRQPGDESGRQYRPDEQQENTQTGIDNP